MLSTSSITYNYPKAISDASTNGGEMSKTPMVSGAIGGLFPRLTVQEREDGLTRFRKLFVKINTADSDSLSDAMLYLDRYTTGGDGIVFFPTTQAATQADITGSERVYGSASLVSIVGSTMTVDVEDSAFTGMFVSGDTIRISDKTSPSGTGNTDEVTISSTPSVSTLRITFNFTGTVVNTYAAGSFVSPIYEHGDLLASISNKVVTSATGGTFDETDITLTNSSTVHETVTLTFINATQFSAVGTISGSLGTGSISTTFAPNNADFSLPLFSIAAAAFGGTFAAGNTIVFVTNPPSIPVFLKEVVPASCSTLMGNHTYLSWRGQAV